MHGPAAARQRAFAERKSTGASEPPMLPNSALLRVWTDLCLQTFEVHQVIGLRMLKLMAGGAAAEREVVKMVAEKVEAAQETALRLASGASPQAAVRHYRSKVRANRRRLLQ
jgi:hypothetical protein